MTGAIFKAKDEAVRRFRWKTITEKRDKIGVYAYIMADREDRKVFLVAKEDTMAGVVSINTNIVDECAIWEYDIVMFIERPNKFYSFKPFEIIKDPATFLNEFHSQSMYNFKIQLGRNIEKDPESIQAEVGAYLKDRQE